MKALKTVAVALGITLAALIVIPLAVLAGLFVWLKLTEEADEELLELDRDWRPTDRPRARHRWRATAIDHRATGRRDPPADDRRPLRPATGASSRAPSSASWSSGPANFIVVKDGSADAAGRLHVPALLAGGCDADRHPPLCRANRCACRARPVPILVLGGVGLGAVPDPLDGRPRLDPGRRLGAHHRGDPVFTAVIAVLLGTDTADAAQGDRRRPRRSSGWSSSSRPASASSSAGSPIGFALTFGGDPLLGDLHGLRARVLRRQLTARPHDLGDGRRRHRPRTVGVGQPRAPGAATSRTGGALADRPRDRLLGCPGGRPRQRRRLQRLLGPTHITTIQALVPAFAVVLAFLFLGEPIRPVQVVGGAIIIAGVALTRPASRVARSAMRAAT